MMEMYNKKIVQKTLLMQEGDKQHSRGEGPGIFNIKPIAEEYSRPSIARRRDVAHRGDIATRHEASKGIKIAPMLEVRLLQAHDRNVMLEKKFRNKNLSTSV
jgi:hypothetical protein